MTKTMSRMVIGLLVAIVACGLLCAMPNTAHAASKVSISVITKEVKKTAPSTVYYNGEEVESTSKTTTTYTYNNVGLIKKYNTTTKYSPGSTYKEGIAFKFNSKNRFVSGKYKTASGYTGTQYYRLDKKGRVKSVEGTVKYKYNAKGRVKKVGESGWSNAFTWDSKGLLTKVAHKEEQYANTLTFTYDPQGQLSAMNETAYESTTVYAFTNTYKNGLLSKRVKTCLGVGEDGSDVVRDTVTYKYKKIKVPKKYAAQVKAQQRWIYLQSAMYYFPPLESMNK